ncbi:MAG: OmpH family outer membrane protein [Phycisphaerales bacterium]|nr:OmpH family outer membrane protein [Phycisphaerales bacterium]MCI0630104.1 OmpH family outer membrane protein [Phycisphaerales bacterium]MCI0674376.1 OmpH family outer membrane protein [Phycisphaerales bacterium]
MSSRKIRLLTATILLAATTVVIYQSGAAAMVAGQPTVVVTVNLASVLEKLDQRTEAEARLVRTGESIQDENEKKRAEIQQMETQLKEMKDSPQKQEHQEKTALAAMRYQAWFNFTERKIDIDKALVLQDLYMSIKNAAGELANSAGYDIVLVDDSQGELTTSGESRTSRVDQIRQQIAGRRTLYVNPAIDITDDLIERMNNAHKVGAKPATP